MKFLILILLASSISRAELLPLHNGWKIQNSQTVMAGGATVSGSGFNVAGWTQATVPSTVLSNLAGPHLGDSSADDPFVGKNFLKLPGSGPYYPLGKNYGEIPTPPESPFGHPWWYRTSFTVTRAQVLKFADLNLKGITYGAEVWLNGQLLANSDATRGSYRQFRFNVTGKLHAGLNTLAVLVGVPLPTDLSPSWVDWNPTPQDKNMGLWREVYFAFHGPVSVLRPLVTTELPSLKTASLTVAAQLSNSANHEVTGVLQAETQGHVIRQKVTLAAGESREVGLPSFNVHDPKLWWPWQMGRANLHPLKLSFVVNGDVSDTNSSMYGMRKVESHLTPEGSRLFVINGRPIFIRGGGWASNLLLRFDASRQEQELRYVRHLGLNTIRLEGRFETEHLLDLADRMGVLVMPGWVCCNAWQINEGWLPEHHAIARASLLDQLYELRSHASVFVFLYGSDEVPPPGIEAEYLQTLQDAHWPNPSLASASDRVSTVGSTGVKMRGPYAYTPPSYWYVDKDQFGGAWGFNTETSPGVSMPPVESLKSFIPADHWASLDDVWNFHMGENEFATLDIHRQAVERRYGKVTSTLDFVKKSEVMDYDNHRAMFEAYQARKYGSATGVVQWMLNSAWPSVMWHLYDFYLRPNAAYYAVRLANAPVHASLDPSTLTVSLLNSTYEPANGYTIRARVLNLQSQVIDDVSHAASTAADSSIEVMKLEEPEDLAVYFVRLDLSDSRGHVVDSNFYWLSSKKEIYNWDATDFKLTPVTQEGDFSSLATLPPTHVRVSLHSGTGSASGKSDAAIVRVTNTGSAIAFFVKLHLKSGGRDVIPVYWQDNNFALLPGETRDITVHAAHHGAWSVTVDGWNVN